MFRTLVRRDSIFDGLVTKHLALLLGLCPDAPQGGGEFGDRVRAAAAEIGEASPEVVRGFLSEIAEAGRVVGDRAEREHLGRVAFQWWARLYDSGEIDAAAQIGPLPYEGVR